MIGKWTKLGPLSNILHCQPRFRILQESGKRITIFRFEGVIACGQPDSSARKNTRVQSPSGIAVEIRRHLDTRFGEQVLCAADRKIQRNDKSEGHPAGLRCYSNPTERLSTLTCLSALEEADPRPSAAAVSTHTVASEQLRISYRILQGTWSIISLMSKRSAAQAISRVVFGLKENLLRQHMLASKRDCQKPNSPYDWRSYDNSATYLGQVCFVPLKAIPPRPLRPKP